MCRAYVYAERDPHELPVLSRRLLAERKCSARNFGKNNRARSGVLYPNCQRCRRVIYFHINSDRDDFFNIFTRTE